VARAVRANKRNRCGLLAALLALPLSSGLAAQTEKSADRVFTLEQAVSQALTNYPALRAAIERVTAAGAGIDLARTSYLPHADMLWQSNRATRNNIFGLLLPQSVIPSLTGPVLATTSGETVWGSAGGILFSWEPFDFGYRHATVSAARDARNRVTAEAALTRLDVAAAAADAFIILAAAEQRVRAAQADVERRKVFAESIHVLVKNELRPGADASRADAELAAARTRLIEAETAADEGRATLAAILDMAGTGIRIDPAPLLGPPPESPAQGPALSSHPFAMIERANVEESKNKVLALERSYVPRFSLQSAVAGRGSGANPDGSVATGLNGLGLERANWAAGLTVTFPLFDFASIHSRRRIEEANERAAQARYDQALQDLTGQSGRARAAWEGARRVAENTPIELQAARDTETQARARYQAGLATIVEVADAQRLLVQAEIDDALARLNVWRTLAQLVAAQGDLEPFLKLLSGKTQGGP
jgi:outer membrane protein